MFMSLIRQAGKPKVGSWSCMQCYGRASLMLCGLTDGGKARGALLQVHGCARLVHHGLLPYHGGRCSLLPGTASQVK